MIYFTSNVIAFGELAQLARALALHARGQGFESLILHHKYINWGNPIFLFYEFLVIKKNKTFNIIFHLFFLFNVI